MKIENEILKLKKTPIFKNYTFKIYSKDSKIKNQDFITINKLSSKTLLYAKYFKAVGRDK